ncbi:MAG: amidohydrolase family protein [Methanophagales archaeon]|nr:amidohydrolase family protein [Methanophagales archaeon]MCW3141019.1 amidohydrolase family protein [Methanophagales archaeon]
MNTWLKNGTVYDPANGIEGEKMDIFISGGKIVDEIKAESEATTIIDASDKAVMPGGIDVHSHVATYGLNLTRFTFGFPTVNEIGYAYARLGYTYVNEPLMTLNTANYVHHELSSIPVVDTSSFLVLSLYDVDKEIREGDEESVKNLILFLLDLTKSIGVKIYDARVKYAKQGFFYRDIDEKKCVNFFYEIIKSEEEKLPQIQLRTYPELLDENPSILSGFCLAHIASGMDNEERYETAMRILKNGGAVDLGIFYPSQKGDIDMRIGYDVPAEGENNFNSVDIGLEKPLVFSKVREEKMEDKRIYYSQKFALEALEYLNSCHISFSTDSPSGCLFYYYPKLFAGLLNSANRKELKNDGLRDIEYSLYELAVITRTNPAKQLCLRNKGHLGNGADADIAIYDIGEDTKAEELEKRLSCCEYLLKGGEVVIYKGELNRDSGRARKKRFYFEVGEKEVGEAKERQREVIERICNRRSFRAEHLRVDEWFIGASEGV